MANEDYQTSTVDGARGWAEAHADDYDDRPLPWELNDWPDEEATDYDDYDRCNCSDPGCPCGGVKRGGV